MTDPWFRPGVSAWRGTPIPPVRMPLEPSPERKRIAGAVWWNGPPWTILRNGPQFVRQVLDFGEDREIRFICANVGRPVWTSAIADARPGQLSRGAHVFWSIRLGLAGRDMQSDWPSNAHIRDVRPLAAATRDDLHARHRLHRKFRDSLDVGSAGTPFDLKRPERPEGHVKK